MLSFQIDNPFYVLCRGSGLQGLRTLNCILYITIKDSFFLFWRYTLSRNSLENYKKVKVLNVVFYILSRFGQEWKKCRNYGIIELILIKGKPSKFGQFQDQIWLKRVET